MKRLFSFFGLFVFAVLFSAPASAQSYMSTLRKWSHHRELYSATTMQTKIVMEVTYYSDEFRKAYTERHIQKKYLNEEQAATYRAMQEKEGTEYDEFFIGFYTRKPYKEFSMGAETFWEAVLTNADGTQQLPMKIEKVAVNPYEKVMFPYLDRWSYAYRIYFPKTDLKPPFKLTMRSVIGQAHVTWKKDPLWNESIKTPLDTPSEL